jgi:hypothetical protein
MLSDSRQAFHLITSCEIYAYHNSSGTFDLLLPLEFQSVNAFFK